MRFTSRQSRVFAFMAFALAAAAAAAQPAAMGRGMMHGAGPMAAHAGNGDPAFAADMSVVHELLADHDKIKRTVTRLPDGIRTLTESDDPRVAQAIKTHVASMSDRLTEGREFNLFSATLPVLFANRDKIRSRVEMTANGSIVTRTSSDPKVVAALQGHAAEVSELAKEGMVAMRRGMMAARGMRGRAGGGERLQSSARDR